MTKFSLGSACALGMILLAVTRPTIADDQLELVISDSGRNAAWADRLAADREHGLTFDVLGADKHPVGGILVGTSAIEQLLVPMPNDAILDSFNAEGAKSLRDDFIDALAWRINQHIQPAISNRVPVFEIRLLEHADLVAAGDRTGYCGQFHQVALEAIGRVVTRWQTERHAQIHITAALADTGTQAFARAVAAWHPYKAKFNRVDLIAGQASVRDLRQMLDELGGKRIRLFIGQEAETPVMTAGRREVADVLITQYPGLSYYLVPGPGAGSALDDARQLPPWFDTLAGTQKRRIEGYRVVDGRAVTTVFDHAAPQQFRDPVLGWDPINTGVELTISLKGPPAVGAGSDPAVPSIAPERNNPKRAPGASVGAGLTPSSLTQFDITKQVTTANLNAGAGWVMPTPFGVANGQLNGGVEWTQTRTFGTISQFNSGGLLAPNVKGVLLRGAAKFEGGGQSLHAGNISLVFQGAAGSVDIPRLRRFTTALWAAYLGAEDPGISIDPVSRDAQKYTRHNVQYLGLVFNTDLGRVMREADYMMKQWSVGSTRPDIPGFRSPDQLSQAIRKLVVNRWSRFWLIPEQLTFKTGGNMLLLSGGRMTVQTEYLDDNPNGEKNPANELFAEWFTNNYETISQHYPVYRELFDYAQSTFLGTYLREAHEPMMWFLLANRELILTEHSVKQVDAIISPSTDPNAWSVRFSGGVVMDSGKTVANASSYKQDEAIGASSTGVTAAMAAHTEATAVTFNVDGTQNTSTSAQNLTLSGSKATGDAVQTDLALWQEYRQNGGKAAWHLTTPGIEVIRHYNPDMTSRAMFGDGWHVLIPFSLKAVGPNGTTPLAPNLPANRIAMVNTLSGISDVMRFGNAGYEPVEKTVSLLVSLSRLNDGTWLAEDVLGARFQFDPDGDLLLMQLRPAKKVEVKLADGQRISQLVDGYVMQYRYDHKLVAGADHKLLVEIRHGSQVAQLDWQTDGNAPRLTGISVRDGVDAQLASVKYELDASGRLDIASLSSGLRTQMVYSNDAMHVAIRNLEIAKK